MMNDVVRRISLTTKEMYDERHSVCLTADEMHLVDGRRNHLYVERQSTCRSHLRYIKSLFDGRGSL